MFFHICSVFIQLILTEKGHHLVQTGATEKIAVLMDVCMYVYSACTCGSARTITIERKRKHALAGTNINFNIDDHFRLEMVVNIEIQILYGIGMRLLCSKFCRLFYSALPKMCTHYSLASVRLFPKKMLFNILCTYRIGIVT